MTWINRALVIGSALTVAASAVQAQTRSVYTPNGQAVPAGMCRIWIDGVAVNQQPAATDCATARARAPRNSRIIYGANTGATNVDPRRSTEGTYDPRRGTSNGTVTDPRYGVNGDGNGAYDPRRDPNSRTYDARLDRNSRQYNPRLDRSSSLYDPALYNSVYGSSRYGNDSRYGTDSRYDRGDDKADRKRDKEREKERRQRDKEWAKSHKGDDRDHERDHDRDHQ